MKKRRKTGSGSHLQANTSCWWRCAAVQRLTQEQTTEPNDPFAVRSSEKKRERVPSVSERRAAEEAAAIAAAEKTRRVKPAVHGVPGTVAVQAAAVDGTPMGTV